MGDPDFICAICKRTIEMRWNRPGRSQIIPPICLYCEGEYSRGLGKPKEGSPRDRRVVAQGLALSEALRAEAARMSWPKAWEVMRVSA